MYVLLSSETPSPNNSIDEVAILVIIRIKNEVHLAKVTVSKGVQSDVTTYPYHRCTLPVKRIIHSL